MPNPKKKRGAGILPCVPCVVVLHFGGGGGVLFFSAAMVPSATTAVTRSKLYKLRSLRHL